MDIRRFSFCYKSLFDGVGISFILPATSPKYKFNRSGGAMESLIHDSEKPEIPEQNPWRAMCSSRGIDPINLRERSHKIRTCNNAEAQALVWRSGFPLFSDRRCELSIDRPAEDTAPPMIVTKTHVHFWTDANFFFAQTASGGLLAND